ncbi:FAD/NAD(P)-binding domain-containing protein [Polychaeton citri CBS 116435]|uniref:FAD/NAD(P)-binding domain-containing protein n=1 Tax=Polychaeton citri CBS 116435 TaxID=1314669 RepID=A0A9P4QG94_9PEZI|nr:FAD/NAD(P)-binding domain-containing protein [Polychaeton citri CBS 116435]
MLAPKVSIVGAGISGLALGRCLLKRGIHATIYERDSAKAFQLRYNYGITLHQWAYDTLLRDLGIDKYELLAKIRINQDTDESENGVGHVDLRANRNRLEQLLSQGLDVKWEHRLERISHTVDGNILQFSDGQTEVADGLIVGADGPHSIVRQAISPQTHLKVLPYAVYNGKRRVSFKDLESAGFGKPLTQTVIEQRHGPKLLKISFDDIAGETVTLSWTYSRPPLHESRPDALYRPSRTKEEAKQIPHELFAELSASALKDEIAYVFNPSSMRQDRTLNWLMRSMLVPREDLEAAASRGLLLTGDSAHSTPILGGDGANQAFIDAVELANVITHHLERDSSAFYDIAYERWQDSVKGSEEIIAKVHEPSLAGL